jgi:hypothetical protein
MIARRQTMTPILIPIHGTFDIARGRNALRGCVAECDWPTTFNPRVAAMMTVLGELILLATGDGTVEIEIMATDHNPGMRFGCELMLDGLAPNRLDDAQMTLRRTSDRLDIDTRAGLTTIRAYLYVG